MPEIPSIGSGKCPCAIPDSFNVRGSDLINPHCPYHGVKKNEQAQEAPRHDTGTVDTTIGPGYANGLPATELRKGDQFHVGGQGEIPGQATVVSDEPIAFANSSFVYVHVKIPKDHVFDHVVREPS